MHKAKALLVIQDPISILQEVITFALVGCETQRRELDLNDTYVLSLPKNY